MKFGVEAISQIVQKITSKELRYEDTIVIGDNSSGKSELLRRLVYALKNEYLIYYIDAVNWNFSVKDISRTEKIPKYNEWILKTRLDAEHFNIADSFNCYGTRTERIEIIYTLFEAELQKLFFELTEKRFELFPESVMGEVRFSEGTGLLSSGYQAIVRILLEMLYFNKVIKTDSTEKVWMIIDELDEFLSPRYAGKIWEFLKEKFPQYYFVATTHSCDLVAGAKNANLIALTEENYSIWDVNDYACSSSVQIIFDKVFGSREETESEIFVTLQNLFGKKINGAWTVEDEARLKEIDINRLSASQALIYKQIVEW